MTSLPRFRFASLSLVLPIVTLFGVAVSLAGGQAQTPLFPLTPSTAINGQTPFAVGDFNGDGLTDTVFSSDTATSGFTVFLNTGSGTAPTAVVTNTSSCGNISAMAAADLNNDKNLDLVLACSSNYVAVLFGKGDGSFQAPVYYAVANLTNNVAFTDLNGDGYPDVLVSSGSGSSLNVTVLLNKGSASPGTLSSPTNYASPAYNSLAVGDFNGDGKQDVLSLSSGFYLFLGNGDGTLQAAQTVTVSGATSFGSPAIAMDFNQDGVTDIAYLANNGGYPFPTVPPSLQVLVGSKSGQFTMGSNLPLNLPYNSYSGLVYAGSTDGKDVDLAITGVATTIALGDGNGGFTSGQSYATPNTTSPPIAATDGSGTTSLYYGQTGSYSVLNSNGDGTFDGLLNTSTDNPFIVGDFNGDGLADIAYVSVYGDLVSSIGRGDGTFATPDQAMKASGQNLASGDFDGDGKADIVEVAYGTNASGSSTAKDAMVYFHKGNGDGTFQVATTGVDLKVIDAQYAATGDFNGDGKLDLIISSFNLDGNNTRGLVFLPGNGDGTFGTPVSIISANPANGSGLDVIFVSDLNHDGHLDFIWGPTIYIGKGDGTFNQQPLGTANTSQQFALGDLNGDGNPDLVVGFQIYAGNADGTFQSTAFYAASIPQSGTATGAAIGDVNGDGKADLVLQYTTATNTVGFLVLLGDGTGNFTADSNFYSAGATSTSFSPGPTYLTRLNNQAPALASDGALDILTYTNGGATALLNQTNPAPTAPAPVATTTALSASATTAAPGANLTLTATVTGLNPTGTVTFSAGSTTLGTGTLTNGAATLTTAFSTAGSYSVTASYGGDTNNGSSTSSDVTVSIVAPIPPDFAITATPSSATVTAGQSATATFTVTPSGGFNSAVTFSCGTLPSKATCTFSPATVTPSGAPVTSTLTIATTAPTTNAAQSAVSRSGKPLALAFVLCLLMSPLRTLRARRKLLTSIGVLILLLGGVLSFTACSSKGGSGTGTITPGTPAGSYTVSVTVAQSGGTSHNVNFTLTVQ